jgi:hypothetical protein
MRSILFPNIEYLCAVLTRFEHVNFGKSFQAYRKCEDALLLSPACAFPVYPDSLIRHRIEVLLCLTKEINEKPFTFYKIICGFYPAYKFSAYQVIDFLDQAYKELLFEMTAVPEPVCMFDSAQPHRELTTDWCQTLFSSFSEEQLRIIPEEHLQLLRLKTSLLAI